METSREDVGIAIRSAFLRKGTQQRFSLFALVVLSILFLTFEKIDARPINYFRSFGIIDEVMYTFLFNFNSFYFLVFQNPFIGRREKRFYIKTL